MVIDRDMIKKMIVLPEEDTQLRSFDKISLYDFSYEELSNIEHDKEIINQLNRIKLDNKVVGTDDRKDVWEKGWQENLDDVVAYHTIDSLMPRYFRKDQPFRLFGRFIHTKNYKLDFELGRVIKSCLFEYYLKPYDTIYEFGCGTGFNLVELSGIFPDKELFGLDYTKTSNRIMDCLREEMGYNIKGVCFDFFNPNYSFRIKENSAIYTIAALEQVGKRWESFLDYVLNEKPALVMHLEPIEELYDASNSILDWMALEFHRKRGYLSGYYTRLLELEKNKEIDILSGHRIYFGNLNDESYSVVIWKPAA